MVKMLASTVKVVSAAGDSNTGVLGDIEKRIEVVSALDDVRVIKARLSDCLIDIRREAERQHTANGEIIEQLTHELNQARKLVAGQQGGNARDLITGLPLRPEAEAALAQSGRAGVRAYAAVFVLDRLQILNVRFGREAGDETLVAFACMVENHLAAGDRLFRWGGPALLAILPRADSIESVRSELGRMMATKLEHSIRTPSRNIMVPITASWTLFPMMAASRLMFQKIDTFAAAPASRE